MDDPASPADRVFAWDMGCDRADFLRLAPSLPGGDRLVVDGDRLAADLADDRRWTLALGPERRRTIARLAVPVTPVTLTLSGFPPTAADTFVTTFLRTFQKGGG